ncbi:MAG: hypothetical protein IT317_18525 [Anaerolineales bacterium]|nr:hypothetical protein [Anaerolineales bacterium]
MEDDLELRRYLRALFRRGWLIALLAVVGAAAGFGLAALRPATYQALALLAVSRPVFALNLTGVDENTAVPLKLYGELALSDGVLQNLAAALEAAGRPPGSLLLLRARLSATAASDTGLLRLSATDSTSAGAVQTANLWAELILAQAVALYGPDSPQMASYAAQLEAARLTLEAADAARAAYQSQNEAAVYEAQLYSLKIQLAAAYDRQTRYTLLLDDARALAARLDQQNPSDPAATTDEATLLLLVAEATNSGLALPTTSAGTVKAEGDTRVDIWQPGVTPLQVQISILGGASSQSVGTLAEAVDAFAADVAARATAAGSAAEALQPQLIERQAALAQALSAASQYGTAVALAEAQYTTLAGLVSQAQIAAQDAAGLVRIASPATNAGLAGRSGRLIAGAIGALGGLIGAVVVLAALEWWRTPLSAPRAAEAAADHAA